MDLDLRRLKDTPPWDWPECAKEILLGTLRGDQASDTERQLAAEMAGDITVIDEQLVDALLSILQNPDAPEELRGRVAISLGPVLEYADTEGFDAFSDVSIGERSFRQIQKSLQRLYADAGVPSAVRRRILEASVRAPQDWHQDAVRAAYASNDEDWKLTAVFSMREIRGFESQIVDALESGDDEIHYQAVCAAGNWEIDAAWSHIGALVTSKQTAKALLLAAIDALGCIRPEEARAILRNLTESRDDDVASAAHEAMVMAEAPPS